MTLRGYKGVIFLLGEFLVLGLVYVVAYYVEDWLDIYRRRRRSRRLSSPIGNVA